MIIHNSLSDFIVIILLLFLIYALVIPFMIEFVFIQAQKINFQLFKRKVERIFKYCHSAKNIKGCIYRTEASKYVDVEYKIYRYNMAKIDNFHNKIAYWENR